MVDFSLYHLSYKEIESIYTHEELLKHYFPDLKIGIANNSPFRRDNNPSFGVFYYNSKIFFKDLRSGEKGNIYDLIAKLLHTDFEGVLIAITNDIYNKNPRPINLIKTNDQKENKPQFELGVKRRAWNEVDLKYWQQFGITFEILLKYNVAPIESIFIGNKILKADRCAYVYKEEKDGIVSLKTYQPYSLDHKWYSNCYDAKSIWEGWTQLPETGDILIWTKSRKDVMSIVSTTGLAAISLQSESMIPKSKVVDELKSRFKTIYLLYDNDFDKSENWGRQLGNKLSEQFGIKQVEIPDSYKAKDYSTLYEKQQENAVQILFNLL